MIHALFPGRVTRFAGSVISLHHNAVTTADSAKIDQGSKVMQRKDGGRSADDGTKKAYMVYELLRDPPQPET